MPWASKQSRTLPVANEDLGGAVWALPGIGWYEWQKPDAKKKRPIHMRPAAATFALAGVYDVWKGANGQAITSFTS